MKCPECKTDNLAGKIICYKCGAKLLEASEAIIKRGKKSGKKRMFAILYVLFLFISLSVLFYFILQKQDIEPLEVSPQAARRLETKLARIERFASIRKPARIEVTQEEFHSLVAEQLGDLKIDEEYAKKNIKLDDIQMRFEGDKLKSVVTMKVKGKSVYVSLSGGVSVVDGMLTLNPDEIKIGKLPVPAKTVQRAMKRVQKERGSLAFLDLPAGVKDVRIEEGKLILITGPEKTATVPVKEETKPATPKKDLPPSSEKKVLTAEEREDVIKKREGNEANSWLQVGNNFANLEMDDLALEYYRKVVDGYPESEQAQEARKRIKEIEAKSESE